jgi:hypothetical protein
LRLIALPTDNIPLNPRFSFGLPCLVSIILSLDLVEPPGVCLRSVVEFTALDSAGQANAHHNLKVALITLKHLVSYVILPQNLVWSCKSYLYLLWKAKLKVNRTGLYVRLHANLAYFILGYTLSPIRLSVKKLAENTTRAVLLSQVELYYFLIRS